MVKTSYPAMWRYVNKWSIILYGLFFFVPIQFSMFAGHFSWKRGKVPRLTHNDMKIQKYVAGAAWREKMLFTPALEWQQDHRNLMHMKYIRKFLRKHKED